MREAEVKRLRIESELRGRRLLGGAPWGDANFVSTLNGGFG